MDTLKLSPELDEAVSAALARLLTNYGLPVDEVGFEAQLTNWRLGASVHTWLHADLVDRARDWFLYRATDRERMPPFGVFLDACRRFHEIDEARARAAEPVHPGLYALPDVDEEEAPREYPNPNRVTVQWSDGKTSNVDLTPPARQYRSFEERQKKARSEDAVEVANLLECLCGTVVYEYPTTRKRTTPDGKRHVCKWAVEALKERRK